MAAPIASQEQFQAASAWLSAAPAAAALPNEIKLEIYGLYKYINSGSGPRTTSRPSIFYPAARAKHDAYLTQYQKYTSRGPAYQAQAEAEARGRYVQIAKEVGWDGRIEDEIDLERIDESDEEPGNKTHTGAGDGGEAARKEKQKGKGKGKEDEGMKWRSVSVMAHPQDTEEKKVEGADSISPIHDAVTSDDLDEVKRLLEERADLINAKDEFGYTPLHLAADRGHLQMVRLLLHLGAEREIQDDDEQTALMLAEVSGRDEIVAILRQ